MVPMGARRYPTISVEKLSPREKSIVRHLVSGMCNKRIAQALGISKTVRNQLAGIYAGLGVRKRAELIVLLK